MEFKGIWGLYHFGIFGSRNLWLPHEIIIFLSGRGVVDQGLWVEGFCRYPPFIGNIVPQNCRYIVSIDKARLQL